MRRFSNLVGMHFYNSFSVYFIWAFLLFLPQIHAGGPKATIDGICSSDLTVPSATHSDVDHSVPRGVLSHGEHWVDLILTQAGLSDTRPVDAFTEIARGLLVQIKAGTFEKLNEKIDGSPAVVLGFQSDGLPFVTYKGSFAPGRKVKQALITSVAIAQEVYDGKPALADLYGALATHLAGRMTGPQFTPFSDYIFQADLLFSPGNDRIQKTQDLITITPNSLSYEIRSDDTLYVRLQKAKVGIVIHTAGKRMVRPDGTIVTESLANGSEKIQRFVEALNSTEIFAITPWREKVINKPEVELSSRTEKKFAEDLAKIRHRILALPSDFRTEWAGFHARRFRMFLNSMLRAPNTGGIYKDASDSKKLDFDAFIEGFEAWLGQRTTPTASASRLETLSYAKQYFAFIATHRASTKKVMQAYYDAIRIQYFLLKQMPDVMRSKLGGGPVEGIMLSTSDSNTIVKFVDRLGFTTQNNLKWDRNAETALQPQAITTSVNQPLGDLPEPFQKWRPGAIFIMMKGQPIHAGHVRMIQEALSQANGSPVFVVVSSKEANLKASTWKELGVSASKKELQDRNYTYIFDVEFKREILNASLGDTAQVYFINPSDFWKYVQLAKDLKLSGKIRLAMGAKELEEERYQNQLAAFADQLEPLVIEMQEGSISGTQVRVALKDMNLGDAMTKKRAARVLKQAFAVLPASLRAGFQQRAIESWGNVDMAVRRVLGEPR